MVHHRTMFARIIVVSLVMIGCGGARVSRQSIEQTTHGPRPAAPLTQSFDGLGAGFVGPHGSSNQRNPSDNTIAVGPDHIVQIVNTRMAIFTKKGLRFQATGRALYGPVPTNNVFRGFGGPCEARNNGDAVARYDQLADRWLIVMPIFSRNPPGPKQGIAGEAMRLHEPPHAPPSPLARDTSPRPPRAPEAEAREPATGPYAMCYAISAGPDPFGPYYRYEFTRELFPDYPRPAIWPDGYYVPTSTGDDVIEKHACVVERGRMLRGEPAREKCFVIPDVNFLNNADLDGKLLPPRGAPNIVLATGGTQLRNVLHDDGIYAWKFFANWEDTSKMRLEGPVKIPVAPYEYLCGGQLTNCVPQPGTERRLDAQGDKIMARVVYRRVGNREMIVATHSVNASPGGGVRWYELNVDKRGSLVLRQQSTFAPDSLYRWMASPAIDAIGNIGIGYSVGGASTFVGQRFAARMLGDPPNQLTVRETILVEGEAAQTNTMRWQDYTQTAIDPSDDCIIWYVGDYIRKEASTYSTRIGAFRIPGCGDER